MKKAIILANGDAPLKSQVRYFSNVGYKTLVCADGGANTARKLNIIPDYIIGDLDSISENNKDYFKDKSQIIKYKRQNDTDVEKCLMYLIKKKYSEVVILGGTGDRLDHTICNLGIIIKYYNKIKIRILHKRSLLQAFNSDVKLKTIPSETISLYGFNNRTKISSKGLKYPLNNISLSFGINESTSNVAIHNSVELIIKDGIIFIIRDYNTMKKHDLI